MLTASYGNVRLLPYSFQRELDFLVLRNVFLNGQNIFPPTYINHKIQCNFIFYYTSSRSIVSVLHCVQNIVACKPVAVQ
jgi:hypothetical protein